MPEAVHPALSQRDGDGWFPSNRTIRSLFPTAFGADIADDLMLPAKLRGYVHIRGDKTIEKLDQSRTAEENAERIRQAVGAQTERLVRLAEMLPTLETSSSGQVLGVADKREALLKLAWEESRYLAPLDHETASEIVAATTAARNIATVRNYLTDAIVVEDLTRRRDRESAPRPKPTTFDRDMRRYESTAIGFLDDTALDTKHRALRDGTATTDELVGPGTSSTAKWEAVRAIDASLWEWRTAALGLASTSPPSPAPILIADEPQAVRSAGPATPWLDTSVERRLASVLRGERSTRTRLPPERDLLDLEVDRSCRPLGVDSHAARCVMALGATVVPMIGARDEKPTAIAGQEVADTLVANRVRTCFAKWKEQREKSSGSATTPYVGDAAEDPSSYYMSTLWKRIHGHDVRGIADYDAAAAHDLLTGTARTVTNRIDARVYAPTTGSGPSSAPESSYRDLAESVELVQEAVDDAVAWQTFWRTARQQRPPSPELLWQWETWTSLADTTLELRDVFAWMDSHEPE
ncbi:hypothetical protein GIY30_02270 [Gordonia sp. HNM0687]|uniref:Uncharacterized protein n=1 Tax=Gordonia mangrovi TaxID=2665643 RepID=A0A6L7GJX9_9ACTN|nr:hypothetical protein [Gordonia mangrovi]MXP20196.1 hypothetical protein [Gordonia mangrovi]UVF79197.1 hypothetical protein NWF22_04970 [Gordonia mangrovi]